MHHQVAAVYQTCVVSSAVVAMIIQQSSGAEIGQETLLVINLAWVRPKVVTPFPTHLES